jgi:hypothetical protein
MERKVRHGSGNGLPCNRPNAWNGKERERKSVTVPTETLVTSTCNHAYPAHGRDGLATRGTGVDSFGRPSLRPMRPCNERRVRSTSHWRPPKRLRTSHRMAPTPSRRSMRPSDERGARALHERGPHNEWRPVRAAVPPRASPRGFVRPVPRHTQPHSARCARAKSSAVSLVRWTANCWFGWGRRQPENACPLCAP